VRAYRIAEVCRLTGLGRTSIYAAIQSGDLVARKGGRCTIVLGDDLASFLKNLPKFTDGGLDAKVVPSRGASLKELTTIAAQPHELVGRVAAPMRSGKEDSFVPADVKASASAGTQVTGRRNSMIEMDILPGPPRLGASKAQIRSVLRQIYDEAGDNPPNVNRAWQLIQQGLPNVTRARVRAFLKEDEFARRRRKPGQKGIPRENGPHR
jgi:hypothetical protein